MPICLLSQVSIKSGSSDLHGTQGYVWNQLVNRIQGRTCHRGLLFLGADFRMANSDMLFIVLHACYDMTCCVMSQQGKQLAMVIAPAAI